MVTLEFWSVVTELYNPETRLKGEAHGHANFPDGNRVVTSPIQSSEGRIVKTKNTIYKLGAIDPNYKKYCDEQGIIIDEKQPVKVLQ